MAVAFPSPLQGACTLFAALLFLAAHPHVATSSQCGTSDKCGLASISPNSVNDQLCQSANIYTSCQSEVTSTTSSNTRTDLTLSAGGTTQGTIFSSGSGSGSAISCCNACKNDATCDAWSFNTAGTVCYHVTTSDCTKISSAKRNTKQGWSTGTGGTGARDRCQNEGTTSGCLDPHFFVQTTTGLAAQEFTFDFHGLASRVYCMLSDFALQLNVRMFGIPASARVLERRLDLGDDFFNGTWMDAIGFVYVSKGGAPESLTVELNQAEARAGVFPFHVAHDGHDLTEALATEGGVTWTSPHADVTVRREAADVSVLRVVIEGMLDMEISADVEEDIIVDPPIHFLNFQLNSIVITPNVHGFLGQMYAPGAVEERLAMGTLDGFRHREYVEGPDEDYEITDLTSTDCKVTRFGVPSELGSRAIKSTVSESASDASATALSRRLLAGGNVPRLLTESAVPSSVCRPARHGAALSMSCSLEV